jgi:DNA-binding XRE family transcriptional regulator
MASKTKKPELKPLKISFDQKAFSNDLYAFRANHNMTFEMVGQVVGLDKSAVFRIETGLSKNMTVRMLVKFCAFMHEDPAGYFVTKK